MIDLHSLPKLRDSLSYIYIEHAVIDRKDSAIEFINKDGKVMVPVAALCVFMLGPGTSISHAAIKVLAENGCTILWVGEDATRCYGQGLGETRKGYHLIRQAELVCDPQKRAEVVLRMYQMRFKMSFDPSMSLQQLRGMEGARVRETYARASRAYGIPWSGRDFDLSNWSHSNPVNRALSAANALLNGICHAGIVSGGYSPGLGFIHSGRQLSFVYDIADLYKADLTIPIAFEAAADSPHAVEKTVRAACREKFREKRLLEHILPDIDSLLQIAPDADPALEDTRPDLNKLLWEELQGEGDELAGNGA